MTPEERGNTPEDVLDPVRIAVATAIRENKNTEGPFSVSDPAWEAIGDATAGFLDDLVREAHRLRDAGGSQIVTDADVRSAKGNLVSREQRTRARAATALGGIALGGGLGGLMSVLLSAGQAPPPNWVLAMLFVLSIGGTAATVWGIRNE
jgi:hypothetical protein